ncbi:hypothetical protein K7X08_016026 [Anisodus acutangulus]|uniref:Uncharacterized protein n=1 Tax=Anisodus acutangulus TaxID=402998 RepID=A0A9Q1QZ94_9SOLA|nr:hypothetical protein K7X08_016026 [Anisodus acutangulus]
MTRTKDKATTMFAALGEGCGDQNNGVDDGVLDVHAKFEVYTDAEKKLATVNFGDGNIQHGEGIVNVTDGQLVKDALPVGVTNIDKPLDPNAKVYTLRKKKVSPVKTK